MTDEEINSRFEVLSQNQNIINDKLNSMLDLMGRQYNEITKVQSTINNQGLLINNLIYDISKIKAKFSDLEIQIQNSDGNISDINNSLTSLSYQIDEIKQEINQWKVYSEL